MHVNWAHVHLMINHIPVIGIPGAIFLLLYGMIRKSREVTMLSMGAFVLIAIMTVAVFLTGESAADMVTNLPWVTEGYIGRHEEVAEYTVTIMGLLGLASLAALYTGRRSGKIPKWLLAVVLFLSLTTAAAAGITANLGGQIRHTEIRDGATHTMPAAP